MKLLFEFVDYFNGKSLVIHADTLDMKKGLLTTVKEINKEGKYAVLVSYNQENCSMKLENVDVHGILLDSQTSIDHVMSCFKYRQRYNKEPWILFVKVYVSLYYLFEWFMENFYLEIGN